MFGKSKSVTSVLAVVLSLLVVSPNLMVALLTVETQTATPALITIQNSTSLQTQSVFNEIVAVQRYVTSETWTNGTMLDISEHILNSTIGLCVNCATWIDPTTTSNTTNEQTTTKTPPFETSSDGLYPYTNRTDNLFFLLKGNNGTCYVSYDHDDNYDGRGYYAGQWDTDYSLNGTQDLHIHLPAYLLSEWISGNDTAALMAILDFFIGHISDIISLPQALSILAILLGLPVVEDPVLEAAGWLSAINDIIDTIFNVYNHLTQANWVSSVVEESYSGDGWAWRSSIVNPGDFVAISNPFDTRFITQYNYYQIRIWNETFGSQGIFGNPGTNTFDTYWFDYSEAKAATPILSDYGNGYPFPGQSK